MTIPTITIMVITLASGQQIGFSFDSAMACGHKIHQAYAAVTQLDRQPQMVQCIRTPAPSASPRPRTDPRF